MLKALKNVSMYPLSEFIFFDYSSFTIPKKIVFSHLLIQDKQYSFVCKIEIITQQFGLIYDEIPKGHKTICLVSFDKHSFDLIHSELPKIDGWTLPHKKYYLSNFSDNNIISSYYSQFDHDD